MCVAGSRCKGHQDIGHGNHFRFRRRRRNTTSEIGQLSCQYRRKKSVCVKPISCGDFCYRTTFKFATEHRDLCNDSHVGSEAEVTRVVFRAGVPYARFFFFFFFKRAYCTCESGFHMIFCAQNNGVVA